ncbi:MAG: hypothetical protein SVY41_00150 [Candidatus Nanohaloarchaea archaeon]|nr:hypothetical protein [Candidatus Nanohaloarchaea archaeon]
MGVRDIVDWPEPHTISETVRSLKKSFTESYTEEGEDEKVHDLNYIVAVSSGKAVSEEIPSQIGRRAGWASQQGANFVELLIENPAQLEMDSDMLINLADQLDLHYNIHSSTSMAYGMSYRRGRGNGYDSAHEYTVKLLKSIRRFRNDMENRGLSVDSNGYPRLYAVNGHMAIAQFPAEEERLAQDVSVDPFGIDMGESDIFDVTEARLGIFKYFIWRFLGVGNDWQEFQRVISNMGGTNEPSEYIQANLVQLLANQGYITDEVLSAASTLQNADQGGQLAQQLFEVSSQLYDVPSDIASLKSHTRAQAIAQAIATSNPRAAYRGAPEPLQEQVNDILGIESAEDLPEKSSLDLSGDDWEYLQQRARQAIANEEPEDGVGGQAYQHVIQFLKGERESREGGPTPAQSMQNLAQSRRLFQDEFNKESSIFRYIVPLWMPFAEEEPVQQIWDGITDPDGEISDHKDLGDWLYGATDEEEAAMDQPRDEEDLIAAATGAYVWGHFTQVPPGYDRERDKSLLKLLEEADVYWSFESHMAGPAENARIWKPKDMIEVVKAINSTPVEVKTGDGDWEERAIDRTRITIDMEHIATQKIDPMWVVDPGEEGEDEGYNGLDDGDGEYILINHVTHPYITEEGHQHGPIRRGDTRVYRYIHKLVEKGMTKDEDLPTVVMYEIGSEKDETLYMLRLILNMIEHGIDPDQLRDDAAAEIINKEEPADLEEYLIQKFFGVTDTEVQHEWQEIHQHALDPLEDLLDTASGGHTWMGRAATERGARPEEWDEEEYR